MPSLLGRLRERKLVQWGVAYLAAAWLLVEVLDILAFQWDWSVEFQRTVSVILALGFPLALVLAWYHGEKGRQWVSGGELLMIAAVLVTAGVILAAMEPGEVDPAPVEAEAAVPTPSSSSVAVLPFRIVAGTGENSSFFAEGLHDRIIAELGRFRDLEVISLTSVMEYRESPKNVKEIGRELHVRNVVEGTVWVADDRLEVAAQLIDARTDDHIWTGSYEGRLSVEDVLAIQTRIAREVATALRGSLAADKAARLGGIPTRDLLAYDYLIRGNTYAAQRFSPERARRSVEMYQRAVELDSTFALAWARLGEAQAMYFGMFDHDSARRERARAAIERALTLAPGLPEARMALGNLYYWGHDDYERALEEFESVRLERPNDSELFWLLGSVERRRGEFERSTELFRSAVERAPRNAVYHVELGTNLQGAERFEEADAEFLRAIRANPAWLPAHLAGVILHATQGRGDVASRMFGDVAASFGMSRTLGLLAHPSLRSLVFVVPKPLRDSVLLATPAETGVPAGRLHLTKAEVHRLEGRPREARAQADSARAALEMDVADRPEEASHQADLALAYAGLGRAPEALERAVLATEFEPVSRNAFRGPVWVENLMRVQVLVGRRDAAIRTLASLKHLTWRPSRATLLEHPWLEPLRGEPAFRTLLAEW